MKNNRRNFIKKTAILGVTGTALPTIGFGATSTKEEKLLTTRPKVLFFDVNETLLDLTQ